MNEATFISALNGLRQRARHTYKDLGRHTGVPPSTLHETLTNRRRPRPDVISAVARVYAPDERQAEEWITCWNALSDRAQAGHPAPAPASAPTPAPSQSQPGAPAGSPGLRASLARGWRPGQLVLLAVLMLISAGAGAGVATALVGSGGTSAPSAGLAASPRMTPTAARTTQLTIYNAETPCQRLRTIECGLSLFQDPRVSDRNTIVGRVYHDDPIDVVCVIEDGRYFIDEAGVSTNRWYKVIVPNTTEVAWIAAVRTRTTVEIARC
ncbi:MAG: helix-turn-helix domain-containing protein [Micromonosporaceae bacterium]|nr:helix-turn-helix domain-containing protein [Micromonosporaceae bacterium]